MRPNRQCYLSTSRPDVFHYIEHPDLFTFHHIGHPDLFTFASYIFMYIDFPLQAGILVSALSSDASILVHSLLTVYVIVFRGSISEGSTLVAPSRNEPNTDAAMPSHKPAAVGLRAMHMRTRLTWLKPTPIPFGRACFTSLAIFETNLYGNCTGVQTDPGMSLPVHASEQAYLILQAH